jgi:hypothetical protein
MVLNNEQYNSLEILLKAFENEQERKVQALQCLKAGEIKNELLAKYQNEYKRISKLLCEITPMFIDQDKTMEEISSHISEERFLLNAV